MTEIHKLPLLQLPIQTLHVEKQHIEKQQDKHFLSKVKNYAIGALALSTLTAFSVYSIHSA
jgi:hypothetical protein